MNIRGNEVRLSDIAESTLCILIGTIIGLLVYGIFLYFHIDIFGWNLGLIFAPLSAGYIETKIAHKVKKEDIGAISAFILFIYTTFYSFILKNPTLGMNIITFGAIVVILQAAFPTLINHILLVVILGIMSYLLGIFKKITNCFYKKIRQIYFKYILKKEDLKIYKFDQFNENESNEKINNLDFTFMTSTYILKENYTNLGQFDTTVIIEKSKKIITTDPVKSEQESLNMLKKGKDECLTKLANKIKSANGNNIIDLKITYSLIGIGGGFFQITTRGMGVKLKNN